ncbi:dehydrogenase [Pseudoxanthomonas kalamensis DSM 18571]|uniref:YciI family protein n=1 Tax=Pseudoxanthomonas kalamensis TaxID=289483 RepID=UPI001390846C|nr:YciI family protein [Pseudoxanthomonas kalamensis]KAF1712703.1 dehydrogenase [Pseudoxanthomonas kalamensis DSM 18571]
MRVMAMVRATTASEAEQMPDTALLEAMGNFNEELVRAGVMLAGEGLRASRHGARIRYHGATRTVIDGPFTETNELIAGFWLWQVRSMDEALEWARRCPPPLDGECEIELRPLYEAEDFGEAMTPELRKLEARLRQRLQGGD